MICKLNEINTAVAITVIAVFLKIASKFLPALLNKNKSKNIINIVSVDRSSICNNHPASPKAVAILIAISAYANDLKNKNMYTRRWLMAQAAQTNNIVSIILSAALGYGKMLREIVSAFMISGRLLCAKHLPDISPKIQIAEIINLYLRDLILSTKIEFFTVCKCLSLRTTNSSVRRIVHDKTNAQLLYTKIN